MKDKIFQKAKIKLTVFYVGVMFCILVIFTSILMFTMESRLRASLDGKVVITQEQEDPVKSASDDIEVFIYSIDGLLLLIIAFSSYFLAGKTLKPIKDTLDVQAKFSADASHDLRTPLAIIMTESEVLLQDKDQSISDYKKVVESNLEEAKKMNLLVNDLLLIARGENAKLEKEKVDLSALLLTIIHKMKQQIENKNLSLEQNIQKDIFTYANKTDIERAIKNILQNAINYTKAGSIKITLGKESKKIMLEIIDTGVGINKKDMPFVFDRFYKAEHSRNDESGSGLGLPIAKTLLERNGCGITITSDIHVGTKVTILAN
jgi:signal transduction histidine kinase